VRSPGKAIVAVVKALAFSVVFVVFWLFITAQAALMSPVIQERCLEADASAATRSVQVDTHWTYIVWPPFALASLDPPGTCVRNSPLHVGLDAVGVWKLPSAEDQVRQHILDQLPASERPPG